MWQNIFTIFSLKDSLFFLLWCLMLKLQSWSLCEEMPSIRNVSVLGSRDILLLSGYVSTYSIFCTTSASSSTQGWLIWEGIGLWRRKLLRVNCQQCHWCDCHGRSRETRQRDVLLEKQMLSSLSGQQQSPLKLLCLSFTVCCVFCCRQYLWQCWARIPGGEISGSYMLNI